MEVRYWQFYMGVKDEMGDKLKKNCREVAISGFRECLEEYRKEVKKYSGLI